MAKYNFTEIEKNGKNIGRKIILLQCGRMKDFPKAKRAYVLDMFPYPSG